MEFRLVKFKDGSSVPVLFLRRREDFPEIWKVRISKDGETASLHELAYISSEPAGETELPKSSEDVNPKLKKAILYTALRLAELEEEVE